MSELYEPLRPPAPLREQVYESLEELILDGRLRSGQRLVESELAAQLGVSRGPIREALQHLERDGWLEVRPRQGTYVREPQEHELEDYFWARTLLEVEAAGRAARRVAVDPEAAEQGVQRLRHLIDTSRQLVAGLPDKASAELPSEQADRRRRYRENSRQFHYAVGGLAGSGALVELLEYLGKRTRWYFSSLTYNSRLHEHEDMLEAIANGDEPRARDLMRQHMDSMSTMSVQAMRERARD
ncbi:GntR family transcriptional regulator [Georgenia sp. 10Sc9-8]|uniref:GntR family transcriptional regulator n=1 Tax=Georgenia halotolerans TaxID=3028317 RepID=A0ABT5TXF2_9MICO|nr:GntR family transcriptional regulator [Georgenia halotolerans]